MGFKIYINRIGMQFGTRYVVTALLDTDNGAYVSEKMDEVIT